MFITMTFGRFISCAYLHADVHAWQTACRWHVACANGSQHTVVLCNAIKHQTYASQETYSVITSTNDTDTIVG